MQIISQMKAVYRNYGQGTKTALIVFAVSVVVSIITWTMFAARLVGVEVHSAVYLVAFLASGLAVIMSLFIQNTFQDNYRTRQATR